MKWRRLRLVFGKRKLRSILAIEYTVNGSIVRTTNQIEIEEAVMQENTSRFLLAYFSLVFSKEIITDLGSLGLLEAS